MSYTRIVLLSVLVALLIGVLGLGGFQYVKGERWYHYSLAERAIAREDYESAKLHLLRQVHKHPDDAAGHALLSRVILDEAREGGRPATYLANPAAIQHLAQAFELNPRDMDLRRRLVRAYLLSRQIAKAAEVAKEVYAEDKTDGDAHLALTWWAVIQKDADEAERMFAASANVVSRMPFHESGLKLTYYGPESEYADGKKYQQALLEAVKLAARLTEEELELLDYRDREIMLQLLVRAQLQLVDPSDKTKVGSILVNVCEKLESGGLVDKQRIAEAVSLSQRTLSADPSRASLSPEHALARRQLMDRSGDITSKVLETRAQENRDSNVLIYWTNAIARFGKGDRAGAVRTLAEGISVAEKLGPAADHQRLRMHLLSARIYMADRNYAEAVEQLKPLEGIQQYDGWGHLMRGIMALNELQLAAALSELQLAEEKLEDAPEVYAGLARVHFMQEQWAAAIPYLEKLLVSDDPLLNSDGEYRGQSPTFKLRLHLDLLKARLNIDQWNEAQRHLAVLRDSDFAPMAWFMAIEYLWFDDQKEKAGRYVRLVREKYPDEVNFVFLEAQILQSQGKPTRADFLFKDFVAGKPHDPVRRLAMARWLIKHEKPEAALNVLDRLRKDITITPKSGNTLNILTTHALIQMREYERAETGIDLLLANPETRPAGQLLQSMVTWAKGDAQRTQELLNQMQLANAQQGGGDRATVRIRHLNGDFVTAVVQNTYYW